MNSTIWELCFIILLLIANGMLSMSEMSIVYARKARLHQWSDEGDKRATEALALANKPNSFLSTVQVGITLVGVLAGAVGGATLSAELSAFLKRLPMLAAYADSTSLALVVGTITLLSLIFGELLPKRLALANPERVATMVARPMKLLSTAFAPLVLVTNHVTDTIMRMTNVGDSGQAPVTSAEIQVMVAQGTEAGVFQEAEQEMVASVLRLDKRRVGALMTPRRDLVWIDINSDTAELLDTLRNNPHSRFPVGDGDLDRLCGMAEARCIWLSLAKNQPVNIGDILEQPLYVPENTTALDLLGYFRAEGKSTALIIDEYGSLVGLVSQHDLFESIVGEIPPIGQVGKSLASVGEDGAWMVDGTMPVDAFRDLFQTTLLPGEDTDDYQTLAGFVLHQLERFPETGESFVWNGLHFEIVRLDLHRVDKVRVKRTSER